MSSQVKYDSESSPFGCWLWEGYLDDRGYPIVWRGRSPVGAHRVVYELELDAVPEDKVLDHTCRNRACVAPHHLEPVTQRENELRKSWQYRARIKRCKNGHALEQTAVVTPDGGRVCRTCNQEARKT